MFKLAPSPVFPAVVLITADGADKPVPLRLALRHKGRADTLAWVERAKTADGIDVLCEIIDGWSDVEGPDGQPSAFSREALAGLLDAYPAAAVEIFNAYLARLPEFKAKNSG